MNYKDCYSSKNVPHVTFENKNSSKTIFCSKCKKEKEVESKRYCRKCHSSYMANWRKTHPLNEQQRFKNIVRRKTNMRIKRGLLIKYPCEVCNKNESQAHHDDYNKPYDVRWLCFDHHREHHKNEHKKAMSLLKQLYGTEADNDTEAHRNGSTGAESASEVDQNPTSHR